MAGDQPLSGALTQDKPPGFVVWFTGLPATGKTTLAQTVQRQLAGHGICTLLLDSDVMRRIFIPKPTYSDQERDWFYGTLVRLAVGLSGDGVNVLIAATANRRSYRDAARRQITRFAEVYVYCSPTTLRQRDPKGLYAAAQADPENRLPGLGAPFEPPLHPEVIVNTDRYSPAEAATLVIHELDLFHVVSRVNSSQEVYRSSANS
jgi:adenylylsulfate kinase